MRNQNASQRPARAALAVIFAAALAFPLSGAAGNQVVPLEGMSYNVDASMLENLKALTGKKVQVNLNSGASLTGTVKAVGAHLLHLEKLAGKDFFDALVRIEDISAIDARFRNFQR